MIELTTTEISRLTFRRLVLAGAKDAALELAEQLLNKDMITMGIEGHGYTIASAICRIIGKDIREESIYNPINNTWFIVVSGFNKIVVEKEHYERIKKELNK